MSWAWRLEAADGAPLASPPSPSHTSQSDAESWLGENWRELSAAGVAQATLLVDGKVEYGPMSLSDG